tara:strand:+ start:564 stop:1136 length:573 start_codon:yes stop_codon:yes gene_type:complete
VTNFSQENSFKNYFEIFDQPLAFDIDFDSVELKRKKMLLAVHPDKYVDGSTTQKRLSLQWTTKINEAYVILKDPAKRAVYLSMLLGNPIDIEKSRLVNVEVLEQQMELRDELADVSSDLSDKLVIKAIIENLENSASLMFKDSINKISVLFKSNPVENKSLFLKIEEEINICLFAQKFLYDCEHVKRRYI